MLCSSLSVHAFIVVVIAISIQLAIQGELVAPLIMRDSSNRIDPSKHDYPDKSALHIYVFPCTTSDTLHLLFIPANRDWSCRRQPGLYVTEKNTPPPVPPDVRRSKYHCINSRCYVLCLDVKVQIYIQSESAHHIGYIQSSSISALEQRSAS